MDVMYRDFNKEGKSAAHRQGRECPALLETIRGSQALRSSAKEESTMSRYGGERQAPFWMWDTNVVSNTGDCSAQHV